MRNIYKPNQQTTTTECQVYLSIAKMLSPPCIRSCVKKLSKATKSIWTEFDQIYINVVYLSNCFNLINHTKIGSLWLKLGLKFNYFLLFNTVSILLELV